MQAETIAKIGCSDVAVLFDSGLGAVMAVLRSEAKVNLIGGILRDAAHANDPSRLKPLRERFIAAKSSLIENNAIAAGRAANQHGTLAGQLLQIGAGAGTISDRRHPEWEAGTAGAETRELAD